jgi:hypothetical protein
MFTEVENGYKSFQCGQCGKWFSEPNFGTWVKKGEDTLIRLCKRCMRSSKLNKGV